MSSIKTGPRSGATRPITKEWQQSVMRRLDEIGWNRSDLARRIGVTSATISYVLGDGVRSTLVRPIDEALDAAEQEHAPAPPAPPRQLPMPMLQADSDRDQLLAIFERLDDVNRGRLLERAHLLLMDQGSRPKRLGDADS